MPSYLVTAGDRDWFSRCRRAWDLGALGRRALEPVMEANAGDPLEQAVLAALAAHYYPGMWAWNRAIVARLVVTAYEREGGPARGLGILEAFQRWSPTVDRCTPLRVLADIDVGVPDPDRPGRELTTGDGSRVRYRDRVALVLVDDDDERVWLGDHRVVAAFAHPDELALDERLLVASWAWEQLELHAPVVGVQYTELRLDGELRRTVVRHTTTEKRLVAERLGRAVRAMLDPAVVVDPTPAWTHCERCPFRSPCLTLQRGGDATPILATHYRQRPGDVLEEGRLGGRSWGMGRGAAPPRWGGSPA